MSQSFIKFVRVLLLKYLALGFLSLADRQGGALLSLICRFSNKLAIRSMLFTTSLCPFGYVTSLSWKEKGLEQSLYLLLICLAKCSQSQLQWQFLHIWFIGLFSLWFIVLDTVLGRCFKLSVLFQYWSILTIFYNDHMLIGS